MRRCSESAAMIDFASEQNVTARASPNEVASLYDRPALRRYLDAGADREFRDARERARARRGDAGGASPDVRLQRSPVVVGAHEKTERAAELHIITPDAST
jgi:hypothetical protein